MRIRALLICLATPLVAGTGLSQDYPFDDGAEVRRQRYEYEQGLEQRVPGLLERPDPAPVPRSFNLGASVSSLRDFGPYRLCSLRSFMLPGRTEVPGDTTGRPWYGTPSLAVVLPQDGVFDIGERELVWFSTGFEPGRPAALDISVARLHTGTAAATVAERPDAVATAQGEFVTVIDLPEAGCWAVTGEFEGERLSFLIQSIDP